MQKKSLLLAWILNIWPGIGLIYSNNTGLGIVFMIIGIVFATLGLTGLGLLISIPVYLICFIISIIVSTININKINSGLA